MKKKSSSYDEAVAHLEEIVSRIQRGQMGLEELRREVQEALALVKACREKLRGIEADMRILLEEGGADEEE